METNINNEEFVKNTKKKLEDHSYRITVLETEGKSMVKSMDTLNSTIEKLTDKLQTIMLAPAKKWETITTSAVVGFVSAIIGIFVGKLF